MKVLTSLVILVLWFDASPPEQERPTYRFTEQLPGQRASTDIYNAHLKAQPMWLADADNPPLSAQAAISIAKDSLERIVLRPGDWGVESLTLSPMTLDRSANHLTPVVTPAVCRGA